MTENLCVKCKHNQADDFVHHTYCVDYLAPLDLPLDWTCPKCAWVSHGLPARMMVVCPQCDWTKAGG